MKDTFSGFYHPSDEEFKKLWSECVFIFDTNSLLNIYRYPKDARELLLKILKNLSDRIWIPHQIAYEYHRNIHGEFINQNNAYQETKDIITKAIGTLQQELKKLRHSNIDVSQVINKIGNIAEESKLLLDLQKELQPNLDLVKEEISSIIKTNVGEEYPQEMLDEIYKEGLERYAKHIPPGYMDSADKKDKISYYNGKIYKDQYGDLVYWKQLLEYAKKEEIKSVILVTDDRKDDWWYKVRGQIKGPAPELILEFNKEVQKQFYMYQTEQFIKFAKVFLAIDADTNMEEAIKDIQEYKNTGGYVTHHNPIENYFAYLIILHKLDEVGNEDIERNISIGIKNFTGNYPVTCIVHQEEDVLVHVLIETVDPIPYDKYFHFVHESITNAIIPNPEETNFGISSMQYLKQHEMSNYIS
ncbi:hypothetical protein PC41400_15910 [Paenibacillus chitinolyticus]|uniref:PIN domain-containing protein n=1 Tax=Paenibacillus chitinolyticus TaxID=79263 RepID=A0A410WXL6_9BACL|nr:PIN domain-containing protein [Paenibacillus chitinolyticus]MCY9589706.1 PIN domain-containing protein [Paenibacillus chitinolyticus]MCY9598293.1 PIN domain-containing protein [Paenibacillus chitinolyticus]QAV19083.1 hypothetical protein PC41400_15910 [Paenibacillus chitinolyticus]